MKPALRIVQPDTVFRSLPLRKPNNELRTREHLTQSEVDALLEAAKTNKYDHRDYTMILTAFRHGLRASEVCTLEWAAIDFNSATVHVWRAKGGKPEFPNRAASYEYAVFRALRETT